MNTESGEAPWLEHYGASVPRSLRYTDRTVYGEVAFAAKYFPKNIAYEFEGRKVTYREMMREIDHAASCFSELGVAKGDRVLICLPNCPQAIASFYGAMRLGAVSTMVHPLSAKAEIDFYLSNSKAKVAVTLDILYPNFPAIGEGNELSHIVVSSVKDGLSAHKAFLYHIVKGRKDPRPEYVGGVMSWKRFLSLSRDDSVPECSVSVHDPAAILYSGGTTGRSKGVLLSSMNINAASTQTGLMSEDLCEGTTTLSVLPMFHGFGLCVGVHMFLTHGYTCILIPRFTPESYARLVVKKKPNYIAGVPTMYEYMINCSRYTRKADLSHLKGIYCGGDTLTVELKEKVDRFLEEHGCSARIREGYGATECVTASCLTPKHAPKRGSIGLPFPDTLFKIARIGTTDRADPMEDGEICICGPSVMMGYVDEPEETAQTLRVHGDGRTWLHTGDIGCMDGEGYIYFRQRIKRMIVSSGYNIYPSQIENVIDAHPMVVRSCAVGVPDAIKGHIIKVFVVLREGVTMSADEVIESLRALCRDNIAKYARPREFEFLKELPYTKVGKIAYTELEKLASDMMEAVDNVMEPPRAAR